MDETSFTFPKTTDLDALEDDVCLAVFTAECLYGKPRTRLEASYAIDRDRSACIVRIEGAAGEAVARVFAGLLTNRLGEAGFAVHRGGRWARPG